MFLFGKKKMYENVVRNFGKKLLYVFTVRSIIKKTCVAYVIFMAKILGKEIWYVFTVRRFLLGIMLRLGHKLCPKIKCTPYGFSGIALRVLVR